MEKSQQRTQKYKGSLETTISNYMPIKWTLRRNKFLEKYNIPKLNQKEIENFNRQYHKHRNQNCNQKSSNKQKLRTRWLHRGILPKI